MANEQEILDIVDEHNQIIGQKTRGQIHKDGLRHREVGVWIYNDAGELLLQRRSADKDIAPDMLDTSAGGHVSQRENYEQAALRELFEETGVTAQPEELILVIKPQEFFSGLQPDGRLNRAMRKVFLYHFDKKKDRLRRKERDIDEFEWRRVEELLSMPDEAKREFSAFALTDLPVVCQKVETLLRKK